MRQFGIRPGGRAANTRKGDAKITRWPPEQPCVLKILKPLQRGRWLHLCEDAGRIARCLAYCPADLSLSLRNHTCAGMFIDDCHSALKSHRVPVSPMSDGSVEPFMSVVFFVKDGFDTLAPPSSRDLFCSIGLGRSESERTCNGFSDGAISGERVEHVPHYRVIGAVTQKEHLEPAEEFRNEATRPSLRQVRQSEIRA